MNTPTPEQRSPWLAAAAPRAAGDAPSVVSLAQRPWPDLGLLTAVWIYVSLSNVLYGTSMKASLDIIGVTHVFAPWHARLLQHLFLYPALIACVWISNRVGWQPLWRAVPAQLFFGLAFSALATPAMDLGEKLVGISEGKNTNPVSVPPQAHGLLGQHDFLVFLAGIANFLLAYAFILALLKGFDFYRRYRDGQLRSEALERSLSAAHLTALRMQLSPHTLFNLLHTIHGNIDWDPIVARSMIVQLSDLLRRLLRAGERELSRLPDELDSVQLYLQLQQRRFAERLTVITPDPVTTPQVWVPSLLLQPLIENAVVHGLAAHEGAVVIRVETTVLDETLILQVVNTVAPTSNSERAEQRGIGLRNVRERLAIQFGDRASFKSGPGDDNQWIAEIRLPLLRNGV